MDGKKEEREEKIVSNVSSVSKDKENHNEIDVRNDINVRNVRDNNQEPENKGVLDVRNDINVRNVRDKNITNLTNITSNINLQDALTGGILELTISSLYNSNPKSFQQIAKEINKSSSVINTIIFRNKDFFQETEKQGKTKFFKLSPAGEQFVQEKIEYYKKKQEFAIRSFSEEEERLKEHDEIYKEIKLIIQNIKIDRRGKSIYLDFNEIEIQNPVIANKILDNPDELINFFKISFEFDCKIIFKNLPNISLTNIEDIRQEHLNKLIILEARSVSLSNVRPVIINIKFECPSCGTIISILQNDFNITHPKKCSCGRRGDFKTIKRDLVNISNIMLEDLQEKTNNPNLQRIRGIIREDLTDPKNLMIFTPGNEIKVTGIVREVPIFIRGQQSTSLNLIFEILYAELFEPAIEISNFSEKEIDEIKEIAAKINEKGLSEINTSFAPDIYGYEEIKNAIILQLCNKRNEPKKTKIRNKPNILLIGDPGTSKSVLANFLIDITPGSRKAVGGGSSAVGITASVIKEEESMGGYRVEPGALVLAKEILVIDELNNLSDDDKPKLQEGMSEQSVSINKANLHVNLKVVAGILATANPRYGSFKQNQEIIPQFNIPTPIINRFDEIFIMRDHVEENRDKEIAKRMIERERKNIIPKYSKDFLKKFFVYIRNFEEPEIDDALAQKLQVVYAHIRKDKTENLMINPRFIEALTRLIKASAKIRLSQYIEGKDVQRALNILKKSHFQLSEYEHFGFENGQVVENKLKGGQNGKTKSA